MYVGWLGWDSIGMRSLQRAERIGEVCGGRGLTLFRILNDSDTWGGSLMSLWVDPNTCQSGKPDCVYPVIGCLSDTGQCPKIQRRKHSRLRKE